MDFISVWWHLFLTMIHSIVKIQIIRYLSMLINDIDLPIVKIHPFELPFTSFGCPTFCGLTTSRAAG